MWPMEQGTDGHVVTHSPLLTPAARVQLRDSTLELNTGYYPFGVGEMCIHSAVEDCGFELLPGLALPLRV